MQNSPSYVSFSKRHFHIMYSSKNFITLSGLFSPIFLMFAHRKQSKWILQGHLTFPEFHGVFSAFKVSVTGLAVLVV